jgi:hypothetical protein
VETVTGLDNIHARHGGNTVGMESGAVDEDPRAQAEFATVELEFETLFLRADGRHFRPVGVGDTLRLGLVAEGSA